MISEMRVSFSGDRARDETFSPGNRRPLLPLALAVTASERDNNETSHRCSGMTINPYPAAACQDVLPSNESSLSDRTLEILRVSIIPYGGQMAMHPAPAT